VPLVACGLRPDVVVDAPGRFRDAVTAAVEDALPSAGPATVRARFTMSERRPPGQLATTIDAVGTGGRMSAGIVLKAPTTPSSRSPSGGLVRAASPPSPW
jgi:LacI family transcriptional regulator